MPAPSLTEVKAYLDLAEPSSWPDSKINAALAAEASAQAFACRVPGADEPWPADLAEALKRRVARNLAMRGLPLSLQTSISELGTTAFRVGGDPEIRRLEAPHRRLVVG